MGTRAHVRLVTTDCDTASQEPCFQPFSAFYGNLPSSFGWIINEVNCSPGWKRGIQNNLDGQLNSSPPKHLFSLLCCSEKATPEFQAFVSFLSFFAAHFILIEQSLPAGHRLACRALSLKMLSHFCLQSNFVPRDRFWKVKVFPMAFFSDRICQIVTEVASQRLSTTSCSYTAIHSLPVLMPDWHLPPTLWYNFPRGNKILPFSPLLVKLLPRMSSAVKAAAKDLISGGCRRGRAYRFRYENIPSAPPSVNLLTPWSYLRGKIFAGFEAQRSLVLLSGLLTGLKNPTAICLVLWCYFLDHACCKFQWLILFSTF